MYCEKEGIDYKLVNAYDNDIVEQVIDCDVFMWHFHHADYKDVLFAKQLILSLEKAGIKCFPDSNTSWHFDDKVGQKYLLESVCAPLVPSYVFYTKKDALRWVESASFPKVFKLRGGAGAANVRLVYSKQQARRLVAKAFSGGFSAYNRRGAWKDSVSKWRQGKGTFKDVLMKSVRLLVSTEYAKMHSNEKGYVYFQDFIPNNQYDIRVIVIGDKAFAIKRIVRDNDFRASGSGRFVFDKSQIPVDCVRISFDTNKRVNAQCLALDYVFDSEDKPLIVEISFGFTMLAYDKCPGFWTNDLCWHNEEFKPQEWMIKNLLGKE